MRRTTAYCPNCYRRQPHLDGRCTVCNPPKAEPERTPEPALSLFEATADPRPVTSPYPHSGSETSRSAAESQDDDHSRTQRERIVRYLCEHGEATRDEMEAALGINGSAMRPRCRALEVDGWVTKKIRNGQEQTALTRSGRHAVLYEPSPRLWRWWRRHGQAAA